MRISRSLPHGAPRWGRRSSGADAPASGRRGDRCHHVGSMAVTTTPGASLEVTLHVNGEARTLDLDPRVTLLDALRERLGLPGSKKGCDHGQCGACTGLGAGERVLSCRTLAATVQGREVTTIEGLADGDELHPVQAAFLEHDGFQCGYCTPGQIMSAGGLLAEGAPDDEAGLREAMAGNICRCGAYAGIAAAVAEARDRAHP